jgi:hypothetical protein
MKQRYQRIPKTEITRIVMTLRRTLVHMRRKKYDVRIGHEIGIQPYHGLSGSNHDNRTYFIPRRLVHARDILARLCVILARV